MTLPKSQLPPATSYHRRPMRAINTLMRGLNRVGLAKIDLSESSLIAAARKQSGLHVFDDMSFLPSLRVLLHSFENEADLNPIGRFMARQSMVRILRHRLMVADLLQRHPEILERKIAPPVVVVGLGRSGTTRLHRLLASDSRFLHLKAWESVNPVPYPQSFEARDNPASGPDQRITGIEKGLQAVLYMSPQIASVHPLGAHEVEEELGLIQHSFSSQLFEIQAHLPSFAKWLMENDQSYAYEYMVVLMKIISWFRNDPEDKPWVLKTPQHMEDLDSLIKVFPDAKIVCTHRDPIKVVGSVCSMAWNSVVRDSDSFDPLWIGKDWLDKTEHMLKETQAIRDQQIAADNQFDILYADIHRDWRAAMTKIYTFIGLPFSDAAQSSMEAWLASNAQHKHGTHKYRLEDFGLSRDEVDQRLMFYREQFDIPYETQSAH